MNIFKYFILILIILFNFACSKPELEFGKGTENLKEQVPVGVLVTFKKSTFGISIPQGYCTASVLPDGNILTNAHCIHKSCEKKEPNCKRTPADLKPAENIEIGLRNKSDEKTNWYPMKNFRSYELDENQDWAILYPENPTEILNKHGSLFYFSEDLPPLEELKNNLDVFTYKVNPPHEDGKQDNAVLEGEPGILITDNHYAIAEASAMIEYAERIQQKFYTSEEMNQLKSTLLQKHLLEKMNSPSYTKVDHTQVIPGNSGSPVLYKNNIIAIIYKEMGYSIWRPGWALYK